MAKQLKAEIVTVTRFDDQPSVRSCEIILTPINTDQPYHDNILGFTLRFETLYK